MKKILMLSVCCLLSTLPVSAVPFLYLVEGTFTAAPTDTGHNLTITVDGTSNLLSYTALGGLTGGSGVTVVANSPTSYAFNFLNTVNSDPTAIVALSDSEDVIGGTAAPEPYDPSFQQFTINSGAPFSFTGGAGTNGTNAWSLTFSGAVAVPELDAATSTLPLFSSLLLIGLAQKRRRAQASF